MTWDLNAEAVRVHAANEKWWTDLATGQPIERNEGELFALMASELSEALEGERKSLMDTHLTDLPMAGVEMADFVIRILDYCGRRNVVLYDMLDDARIRFPWIKITSTNNRAEVIWRMHSYLADASRSDRSDKARAFSWLIADARLYCEVFGYDFDQSYERKMQYNATRHDHTIEARRLANGTKF